MDVFTFRVEVSLNKGFYVTNLAKLGWAALKSGFENFVDLLIAEKCRFAFLNIG